MGCGASFPDAADPSGDRPSPASTERTLYQGDKSLAGGPSASDLPSLADSMSRNSSTDVRLRAPFLRGSGGAQKNG